MTIFYSDVEPLSKYSPVMLHLSPATRICNEDPAYRLTHILHYILYSQEELPRDGAVCIRNVL